MNELDLTNVCDYTEVQNKKIGNVGGAEVGQSFSQYFVVSSFL